MLLCNVVAAELVYILQSPDWYTDGHNQDQDTNTNPILSDTFVLQYIFSIVRNETMFKLDLHNIRRTN